MVRTTTITTGTPPTTVTVEGKTFVGGGSFVFKGPSARQRFEQLTRERTLEKEVGFRIRPGKHGDLVRAAKKLGIRGVGGKTRRDILEAKITAELQARQAPTVTPKETEITTEEIQRRVEERKREEQVARLSERDRRTLETLELQGKKVDITSEGLIIKGKDRQTLIERQDDIVSGPLKVKPAIITAPLSATLRRRRVPERPSGVTERELVSQLAERDIKSAVFTSPTTRETVRVDFEEAPTPIDFTKPLVTDIPKQLQPKDRKTFLQKSVEGGETFPEFRERIRDIAIEEFKGKPIRGTMFSLTALTGRGFGTAFETAKRHPVLTAVSLGLISGGVGLAARVLTLGTGISLSASKALVGTGVLVGFGAAKEFKEPGAVRTIPGAISTTTEFGTFAIGAKAGGTALKAAKVASPKFIPFVRTTQEVPPPATSVEQIPLFEGTTRVGTSFEQAIQPVGEPATFFTTTGTRPVDFFSIKPARKIEAAFGKAKFEVEAPKAGEVGGERGRFGETFFFLSRGEAFPIFGEQSVGRLGMVSRVPQKAPLLTRARLRVTRIFTEFSTRRKELFTRSDKPTILRFQEEEVTGFSKATQAKIGKGVTGSKLRVEIDKQIRVGIGKIRPGPRTSALGRGEMEFVIPEKTEIFLKTGPERFTFLPNIGKFAKVIDVGLEPGAAKIGRFNLPGRLRNLAEITTTEIFGIRGKGTGRITERPVEDFVGRRPTPPRRIPERFIELERPPRAVTRERAIARERTAQRERARARERLIERARTTTRERTPIRERDRLRERERIFERARTTTRERTPIRERDTTRDRTITRRTRIPFIDVPPPPPPPPFIPELKLKPRPLKKKKKKKKGAFVSVFNPSLRASALKIFAPTPEIVTGIGLRPIPVSRRGEFKL